MSDENRDYPAWLDEELFAGLTEENAPVEPQEVPAESAPGSESAEKAEAPKKKKKPKTPAPAEEKSGAAKTKKSGDAPKAKKKKPADGAVGEVRTEGPDPVKKKSGKAAAAKAPKAGEKTAKADEKAPEAEEKTAKNRKKKGRKAARSGLVALIVLVSLALIVVVATGVCAYLVTNSGTNLPNVYLGGVYVGGMTKEQTIAALNEAKWDETRGGTLKATLPEDVSFELDFLTAGAYQPKEEAAETAIAYGHGEDMLENLMTYVRGVVEPVDLCRTEFKIDRSYVSAAVDKAVDEFEERTAGEPYKINEKDSVLEVVKGAGDLTLDRNAICDKACELLLAGETELVWTEISGAPVMPDFAKIAAELNREPADASYDPTKDEFIPEVVGIELNAVQAGELWKQAGVMEKFSVPIKIIEPEITLEDLEGVLFHDLLGSCTTSLMGSSPNRISNIKVACSRFDGKILMPGERFSYDDVVGERTEETGFKSAPVYSGTDHTMGIGGGICQVSSTLYNAVQYANLEVNERHSHSMFVGYLAPGLDATVDWGAANFVFTNNSKYPIRIKTYADVNNNRKLTIEIWGTNADGIRVEIIHGGTEFYDVEWEEKYGILVGVGYTAWNFRRVWAADGSYTDGPYVHSTYYYPPEDIHYPPRPDDHDDEPMPTPTPPPSTPDQTPPPSQPDPTPPPSQPDPTPPPSTPPDGGENTGGDNTGGDNTGGDNTGGDNTGGDSTGGGDTGGGDTGGGDNSGGGESGGGESGGEGGDG